MPITIYPGTVQKRNSDGTYSDLVPGVDTSSQNSKADKSDLTSLNVIGTTNTTGNQIDAGTYFYLNGALVKAKVDIADGATFTSGTNYEVVTVGEELAVLNDMTTVTKTSVPLSLATGASSIRFSSNNVTMNRYGKLVLLSGIIVFELIEPNTDMLVFNTGLPIMCQRLSLGRVIYSTNSSCNEAFVINDGINSQIRFQREGNTLSGNKFGTNSTRIDFSVLMMLA